MASAASVAASAAAPSGAMWLADGGGTGVTGSGGGCAEGVGYMAILVPGAGRARVKCER